MTQQFPISTVPLIGRDEDLAAVFRLLTDPTCRLLTLVGPGGIGKTRLAVEVGKQTISGEADNQPLDKPRGLLFPDGVFFIPLQSVSAPELVVGAIGDSAGFQFYQGANLQEQLIQYLQLKQILLILDNLEHLVEGLGILAEILAAAPGVKLLTTSREALNLQEEWLYPLSGMKLPADHDPEPLEEFSSIQLFVLNAQRIRPQFSLEVEREDVVRICQLVGGIPLGIELAAAWVRSLSCREIADEIARSLDILESPARNIPARHRNMRAVLDQSWRLLTDNEQGILARLSVFRGGCTRDAAESVTGASKRVLSALVDKSWLNWDAKSERYDIHELLRQYAEEKLLSFGESDGAGAAHAKFFANFMQLQEGYIKFRQQIEALKAIEQDFANVRQAWQYGTNQRHEAIINRMAEALNFFCDMKARFIEGEELFRSAANAFSSAKGKDRLTYNRLWTRRARMILLGTLSYYELASVLVEQLKIAAAINREENDLGELAFSLNMLGIATVESGQTEASATYFQESLNIYQELNDQFYIAEELVWLGLIQWDTEVEKDYLERALQLQRHVDDQNGLGWTLSHLAGISFYRREFAQSERYSQEALSIQRRRGDLKGLYWSTTLRAEWSLQKGDFEKVEGYIEEGLKIALTLNLPSLKQTALATYGLFKIVTEENIEQGTQFCQEALQLDVPHSFQVGHTSLIANTGLAISAYQGGDLSELQRYQDNIAHYIEQYKNDFAVVDCFTRLAPTAILIFDRTAKTEQAIEILALALKLSKEPDQPFLGWLGRWSLLTRLRAEWQTALGSEVYEAAWERGEHLSLEDALYLIPSARALVPPPQNAETIRTAILDAGLTPREQEILQLVAEGLSNREIAERLIFSVGTVKWYVNQIYGKLGVGSRTQAIARAREIHLLN